MKCELCESTKECALVEVSTYDRESGEWYCRMAVTVCDQCSKLVAPIITASVKSWTTKQHLT